MKNDASGNSGLDYSGSEVSSGGSFIVNAVNPSLLTWDVMAGYRFNPRLVTGLNSKNQFGSAGANGWQIGAYLLAVGVPVGRNHDDQHPCRDYQEPTKGSSLTH